MYMKYLTTALLVLVALSASPALGDECVDKSALRFYSRNQRLEVNGSPMMIKGANWWGLETGSRNPGGLHKRSVESILDFLVENKFNGIRMPFSLDVALNPYSRLPTWIDYGLNPNLNGKTSIEVLDYVFEAAAARGIVILLDLHTFDPEEPSSSPVWYTDPAVGCTVNPDGVCVTYTIEHNFQAWDFLVGRYQSYWNFWGVDLLNEPHSWVRWGNGNPNSDWAIASATIGNHIISSFPNWKGLILVEGVEANPHCEILGFPGCETCVNDGHWWGGNLEGLRCTEVALSDQDRLVYSPHVYGPSVFNQAYFSDPDLPNNLEYIYDTHFGFAAGQTGRAIVIGEWGGYYEGKGKIVQDFQADYFRRHGISGQFYWAINPNPTGDTDGLLNPDWVSPNTVKLNFLNSAFPTSTKFTQSGNQVCFTTSGATPVTPAPTPTPPVTPAPTPTPPVTPAPTPTPPVTPAPTPTPPVTPAPPTGETLKVGLNGGSSEWWIGVVVNGGGETTVKVEVQDSGTISWSAATDEGYAYVYSPSTPLRTPISVRLTSSSGKQVVLTNFFTSFTSNGLVDSGKSYSSSNPNPTPVTPAPTPVTPAPTPVTPAPTPVTPAPTPVTPAPTPVTPAPTPVTPAPGTSCSATVTATARPGGTAYSTIYQVSVTNTGKNSISSLSASFAPASGSSLTQSWGMQKVSGNTYSVKLWSNLAVGATVSGAGFEIVGSAVAPSVSVTSISC